MIRLCGKRECSQQEQDVCSQLSHKLESKSCAFQARANAGGFVADKRHVVHEKYNSKNILREQAPRTSKKHQSQKNNKKSIYWSPYSTFEYAHLSEWPAGHVQLRHPNHTLRWDWADHPFRQLTSALALLINQASKRNWQVIPVCSEGMRFLTKQQSQIHKTSAHPEIATLERLFVQECGGRLIILGILQKGRSLRWFLPQLKT